MAALVAAGTVLDPAAQASPSRQHSLQQVQLQAPPHVPAAQVPAKLQPHPNATPVPPCHKAAEGGTQQVEQVVAPQPSQKPEGSAYRSMQVSEAGPSEAAKAEGPPKQPTAATAVHVSTTRAAPSDPQHIAAAAPPSTAKRRGRPPKPQLAALDTSAPAVPKRRGRPPKVAPPPLEPASINTIKPAPALPRPAKRPMPASLPAAKRPKPNPARSPRPASQPPAPSRPTHQAPSARTAVNGPPAASAATSSSVASASSAQRSPQAMLAQADAPVAAAVLPAVHRAGWEVHGGVAYVDAVRSARAPRVPPVVQASPDTWQAAASSQPRIVRHYGAEPMAALLRWLKYAARQIGGRDPRALSLQRTAETASLQQMLLRHRQAAFCGDGYDARRRSGRTRQGPALFKPTFGPAYYRMMMDPEEETDTRRGAAYQAVLPPRRPRPAAPTPEEQRWLAGGPLTVPAAARYATTLLARVPTNLEIRVRWAYAAKKALEVALGGAVAAALGLARLGADDGADWSDAEVTALEAGMAEWGRDFHAIHGQLLPSKPVARQVDFYYNVWKSRATPRARAWYTRLEQERVEEEVEMERWAAERAAEDAARAVLQAELNRQRVLGKALEWLRDAASSPTQANLTKVRVKERLLRARAAVCGQQASFRMPNMGAAASDKAAQAIAPALAKTRTVVIAPVAGSSVQLGAAAGATAAVLGPARKRGRPAGSGRKPKQQYLAPSPRQHLGGLQGGSTNDRDPQPSVTEY